MSTPDVLRLTDQQISAIMAAARPLERGHREAFLEEVAAMLQKYPEVGDGQLHQLLREVQRKHFDAPLSTAQEPRRGLGHGKYA
jgi:hypothetical protein